MSGFLFVAFLMAAVAVAVVVWPLVRRPAHADVSRTQLNTAIYRDQIAELERDRAAGTLSQADHDHAKAELQRRMLEDVSAESVNTVADSVVVASASPHRASRLLSVMLAVFLLVGGPVVYLAIGTPQALHLSAESARQTVSAEQVRKMIVQLLARLESEPNNHEGWAMLARAYRFVEEHPNAMDAFARSGPLLETSAELLVDYADSAATAASGFDATSRDLLDRALKLDPSNLQGLWMRGTAHFDRQQYALALADWEKLLSLVPADAEVAATLRGKIEQARSMLGDSAQSQSTAAPSSMAAAKPSPASVVDGRVEVAPQVARNVSPGDALMVVVRSADGNPAPVAVLRVPAQGFPMRFSLDDSLSMMDNRKVSQQTQGLLIEARISKSGQAKPQPGDLFGAPVNAKPGDRGVVLMVDQVR